jgi:uncharacterized protein (DUF1684 family)
MISPEYEQQILKWRVERDDSLRRENGWLALAGLYWLNEGVNGVGSEPSNQVVLPERFPSTLGTILLEAGKALLQVEPGITVQINGEPATRAVLKPDTDENPSFMSIDDIRMVLIDRASGMGVRLWDNQREERQSSPGRQWFPINEALRIPANWTRYAEPKKVLVPDIFGAMVEDLVHGQIDFEIEGRALTLQASQEEDGQLVFHFMDQTSGKSTYPPGRYFVTQEPISQGAFTLDFNYAYNPPCVFTPYATCAFAPPENNLPVPIQAGERYAGLG